MTDHNDSPASGSPAPRSGETRGPVLLFDGECGLCARFVIVLLRIDRRGILHFAPLQGSAGQAFLKAHGLPTADFESMVYVPDWSHRERSDFLQRTAALIAAARACGGFGGALLSSIRIIPGPLRDVAYRWVARIRRRLFGTGTVAPKPEWRSRFLG